jgi:hypothetical protein
VHACGEVRGYWIVDGILDLRHPSSPKRWFSLDAAVGRVLRMPLVSEQR